MILLYRLLICIFFCMPLVGFGQQTSYTSAQADSVISLANSIHSPSFGYLLRNLKALDQAKGGRTVTASAQFVLYKDLLEKQLNQTTGNPDWNLLKKSISKYGDLGMETYWKAKFIYHLNHKEWSQFAKSFQNYFELGKTDLNYLFINNYAFEVFRNCKEPKLLQFAIGWTDYALGQLPIGDTAFPAITDTKACLLYKTGEKEKAIQLERKAIELAKSAGISEKEFKVTLDKMLNGTL